MSGKMTPPKPHEQPTEQPTPRKILHEILYLANVLGVPLRDQKDVHELVHRISKHTNSLSMFTFSRNYPYPWSYEVEAALQSLMQDGIVEHVNNRYTVTEKPAEPIPQELTSAMLHACTPKVYVSGTCHPTHTVAKAMEKVVKALRCPHLQEMLNDPEKIAEFLRQIKCSQCEKYFTCKGILLGTDVLDVVRAALEPENPGDGKPADDVSSGHTFHDEDSIPLPRKTAPVKTASKAHDLAAKLIAAVKSAGGTCTDLGNEVFLSFPRQSVHVKVSGDTVRVVIGPAVAECRAENIRVEGSGKVECNVVDGRCTVCFSKHATSIHICGDRMVVE